MNTTSCYCVKAALSHFFSVSVTPTAFETPEVSAIQATKSRPADVVRTPAKELARQTPTKKVIDVLTYRRDLSSYTDSKLSRHPHDV